jgi:hypothetical protein
MLDDGFQGKKKLLYIYISTYMIYINVYIYEYIYKYVYIYIYMYIYIYRYVYIFIYKVMLDDGFQGKTKLFSNKEYFYIYT